MNKVICTFLIIALAMSVVANADCMNDQKGNVVCGKGQCEVDQYGKIYCADVGGGAMRDQYSNVKCGVGYCAKDDSGHVWCSKAPGGGAAVDTNGKVKCFGGCNEGSTSLCKEGQ